MSFNDYLKNRQNALQQMTESLKQSTQTEFKKEDDRMWKPQMGQDGTGYAVFVSCLVLIQTKLLGSKFLIMAFKVLQVSGILKTHLLHSSRLIQYLN